MAFLDNDGDIILDAVLTDEGRRLLAKGDGSFNITKFAFGDDEIDYGLFDPNHASGSAYYDLEILQSPIFEAFTNNASSMKSKVITVSDPNLLYLPVIKLNDKREPRLRVQGGFGINTYMLPVDEATDEAFADGANPGIISSPADLDIDGTSGAIVRVDQGLDTDSISFRQTLASELVEDTFVIEVDNRLCRIISTELDEPRPNNVDDDGIATYVFAYREESPFISKIQNRESQRNMVIAGPRGNFLRFRIRPQDILAESDYYFDLFGSTGSGVAGTFIPNSTLTAVKYIDSVVTIYGASTGYTVQIPIRFIKDNS